MLRLCILKNSDGSHDYNNAPAAVPVPDGWAVVPPSLGTAETLENFPFGDITVDSATPPTVTEWKPLPIPEPEPTPDPAPETQLTDAELAAAIMEGVNGV